jgi:cell division protein FtsL
MIAQRVPTPDPVERAAPYSRSARTASVIRVQRARVGRYRGITRVTAIVTVLTLLVLSYVLLVANITRTNYELSKARAEERTLAEQKSRLDDQLDELTSPYRLEQIAAKLGMHETSPELIVDVPPVPKPQVPAQRTLISSLFGAR